MTIFNKLPKATEPPIVKKTVEKKPKSTKVKTDLNKSIEEPEQKKPAKKDSDTEDEKDKPVDERGPECITTKDDFIQSLHGDELKLFNEIYTACFTNNINKLKQVFEEKNQDKSQLENENKMILIEKLLNKRLNKENGFTLLHLTSELGHSECVWLLLLNGCDPALADLTKQRRLPYFVSSNKQTRDQYRRFMNDYPTRYDYKTAKITSPLSQEQMNEKAEKEKEKKRNQRKQKKQREAVVKQQKGQQEIEAAEKERVLSLTDQENRRRIIDRNVLNIMPINANDDSTDKTKITFTPTEIKVISRCWTCGCDMSCGVPFEYFDYKFCTTKCLKVHREQQAKSPK